MFNRRQLASLKPRVMPLGLFAVALAARVPGLDTFGGRGSGVGAGIRLVNHHPPDGCCVP